MPAHVHAIRGQDQETVTNTQVHKSCACHGYVLSCNTANARPKNRHVRHNRHMTRKCKVLVTRKCKVLVTCCLCAGDGACISAGGPDRHHPYFRVSFRLHGDASCQCTHVNATGSSIHCAATHQSQRTCVLIPTRLHIHTHTDAVAQKQY